MRRFAATAMLTFIAASTVVVLSGPTAQAAGCGGYVNVAVWGCAPWDHNPPKQGVTPGYKPAPAPVVVRTPAPAILAPNPVISTTGGRAISDNGSGVISDHGIGLANRPTAGLTNNMGSGFRR